MLEMGPRGAHLVPWICFLAFTALSRVTTINQATNKAAPTPNTKATQQRFLRLGGILYLYGDSTEVWCSLETDVSSERA